MRPAGAAWSRLAAAAALAVAVGLAGCARPQAKDDDEGAHIPRIMQPNDGKTSAREKGLGKGAIFVK